MNFDDPEAEELMNDVFETSILKHIAPMLLVCEPVETSPGRPEKGPPLQENGVRCGFKTYSEHGLAGMGPV